MDESPGVRERPTGICETIATYMARRISFQRVREVRGRRYEMNGELMVNRSGKQARERHSMQSGLQEVMSE
jgi:hypothetical protein